MLLRLNTNAPSRYVLLQTLQTNTTMTVCIAFRTKNWVTCHPAHVTSEKVCQSLSWRETTQHGCIECRRCSARGGNNLNDAHPSAEKKITHRALLIARQIASALSAVVCLQNVIRKTKRRKENDKKKSKCAILTQLSKYINRRKLLNQSIRYISDSS